MILLKDDQMELNHKHLIVNATVSKPPTEVEPTINWMKRLIEAVNMKLVIGPFAHYCTAEDNNGITATCCIETSHASLHAWEKLDPPILRVDLYSCADFDKFKVFELIKEFDPYQIDWMILDRNNTYIKVESFCYQKFKDLPEKPTLCVQ
jgi:S-adenosylmethionine/arginine decarboxylase-like enzyme